MLLNLLQGNLPRVELGARMATSDCHRSESDVADSKEEIHLHRHQQVTLLHDHDFQTGQGSAYK
eukprot:3004679-Pyramimonas_sp.AAC.2